MKGPTHKAILPRSGGAGRPGPCAGESIGAWGKAKGATAPNNYWSATTYAPNPTNAWNVNFNNGNVNNDNKANNNFVRAVRGGS